MCLALLQSLGWIPTVWMFSGIWHIPLLCSQIPPKKSSLWQKKPIESWGDQMAELRKYQLTLDAVPSLEKKEEDDDLAPPGWE